MFSLRAWGMRVNWVLKGRQCISSAFGVTNNRGRRWPPSFKWLASKFRYKKIDSAINNSFVIFQLQDLFPSYKDCIYRMREPTAAEVIAFLKPIITEAPLQPPLIENNERPPPLPLGKKWCLWCFFSANLPRNAHKSDIFKYFGVFEMSLGRLSNEPPFVA